MRNFIILAALGTAMAAYAQSPMTYPKAPTDATVREYFGHKVAEPYAQLENDTAAATAAWVEAERALTSQYLNSLAGRQDIRQRLTTLNNYAKQGLPGLEEDGMLYYYLNDGLQNQAVLYRTTNLDDNNAAELFLDPNKLSDDGTVALTGVYMSPDGKYTAYTISRSGSDWTEIYVMDTKTGQLLDDHIEWAKFTGAAWDAASEGFYYSAYPRPEAGKEFSNANDDHIVYYHRIGQPQTEDIITFQDAEHPRHFHQAFTADEGNVLFIEVGGEGNGSALMFRDLRKGPDAAWTVIERSQDFHTNVVGVRDGKIYMLTTIDAPMYRLVAIDMEHPERENWEVVIPEDPTAVLASVDMAGDKLLVTYDRDASNHLYLYNMQGHQLMEVKMPGLGSIGTSSSKKSPEAYVAYSSFNYPSTIYRLDTRNGELKPWRATQVEGFNPDDYVVEQVFYPSKDGTKIPMFLTYKKGLKRDGSNPVYLYGYGGFNIGLYPGFSANRLLWLERGGIYAQAGLRGGSEYGHEWHMAGTKMQKQNVFDDFISAAEYMINEGWTTPEHLVIEGGSNGGLLVGATVNQRPDLFAVAIPRVGVMDMMRYHLFTIGWNWAHDYGTSDDSPEMAEYLLAYSPMHNISNDGTPYPAILVTTADHDDRVVPAHSFKYAATLQASETGNAPKLIRIDSKAGHGGGKPVGKVIDEWTDIYSFIFNNLK